MAEKRKKSTATSGKTRESAGKRPQNDHRLWKFLIPVLLITLLIYLPALQNGFTNWDDILYVTQNKLLTSLDGAGLKAIFSTPVVSNYHPLTILSLAINYQIAALSPWSYHLTSIVLHTINTGLVFWLILLLSKRNLWASAVVALLFGIHPMHVESVAWISERKDLLYTLFYLAALISHIRFIDNKKLSQVGITTILGAASLLCKPAAIVLPLSLLLIDYYQKRKWTWAWVTEKIPLFLFSGIMAYVTVAIQSKRAIASVQAYDIVERISFAGFGWVWYIIKSIAPFQLSGLHPFPKDLSVWYYVATAIAVASILFLLIKVRNRLILFGIGFYTVNLLLVLQLVSIGNAVVAERYTYVPYIGLFFLGAMLIAGFVREKFPRFKIPVLGVAGVWIIMLCVLTFLQIPVWKNSQTLWTQVVTQYPDSPRAWTNKGLDFYEQQKMPEAIEHLTRALAADSLHADAREWRSRAYLDTKDAANALADARIYYRYFPSKEAAKFLMARALDANQQTELSINMYGELIAAFPKSDYYNNRGVVYFNRLRQYDNAKNDFEKAIQLNPESGSAYVNLSRCYYMASDLSNARKFAAKGQELGNVVDPSYAKLIELQ